MIELTRIFEQEFLVVELLQVDLEIRDDLLFVHTFSYLEVVKELVGAHEILWEISGCEHLIIRLLIVLLIQLSHLVVLAAQHLVDLEHR